MRCYWDEEDVWFYFEVSAEGWVNRQVEFEGPELTPIAAASLAEWQQASDTGRLDEYDSWFGITAELPVSEWEGHDPEELTSDVFEKVWESARRQLTAQLEASEVSEGGSLTAGVTDCHPPLSARLVPDAAAGCGSLTRRSAHPPGRC